MHIHNNLGIFVILLKESWTINPTFIYGLAQRSGSKQYTLPSFSSKVSSDSGSSKYNHGCNKPSLLSISNLNSRRCENGSKCEKKR